MPFFCINHEFLDMITGNGRRIPAAVVEYCLNLGNTAEKAACHIHALSSWKAVNPHFH